MLNCLAGRKSLFDCCSQSNHLHPEIVCPPLVGRAVLACRDSPCGSHLLRHERGESQDEVSILNPSRNRYSSFNSRYTSRFACNSGIGRWPCHGPAKLREQPDGGPLDELVFGVGVGHESLARGFDPANLQSERPARLPAIRNPTELTFAGFSDGMSASTRPRKVGTESPNASRCSPTFLPASS